MAAPEHVLISDGESCDASQTMVDVELYNKMLKERDARLKHQNEYSKRKYQTDPDYRERNQQAKQDWARRKYREDPEYAEKQKAYQRKRYALRKGKCVSI